MAIHVLQISLKGKLDTVLFPRHSFAREGVISKYWSAKRTKQVDCPNTDTQPPTMGEMTMEEQVQWSSSSKAQVPFDSAKPKGCYERSHER